MPFGDLNPGSDEPTTTPFLRHQKGSEAAAQASARLAPMMGIEETATLLDVSQTTIRRLIKDGRLTAYRIGGQFRISQEDVRAYLATVRHGRP